MSNGVFVRDAVYESDAGPFHRIRVQPETLELVIGSATNVEGAGPINAQGSARVSGSRRRFGVNARSVTIEFTGNAAQTAGFTGDPIRLPWLRPASWFAIIPGQVGTYLGFPIRVVGKSAEIIR